MACRFFALDIVVPSIYNIIMNPITLPDPLVFEWDAGNQTKNFTKHGVTIRQAEAVILHPDHITFDDPAHSDHEKRYVAIGLSIDFEILTVIFTIRKNIIRIISARPSSKKERSLYEKTP